MRFVCAFAVSIAAAGLMAPAAGAGGTYVALGDSVAAGAGTYVSDFFQYLGTPEGGALDTVYNDAVSGETSGSLRTGGQLTAAIAQIDGGSDTKLVTIDIGGNDRFQCGGPPPTWYSDSCPFASNFEATLADLEAALDRDPGSEALLTMTYYNPASGTGTAQEQSYDLGLLGTDLRIECVPSGDPRLGLDDRITCISLGRGALVADVYPVFKQWGQALMSSDGLHPNSAGQAAIAAVFRQRYDAWRSSAPPPPPPPPPPPAATAGDDRIVGTAGPDFLCGLGGSDVIFGLAGDDLLFGDACGAGARRALIAAAGDGGDTLYGGAGDDRLYGEGGDDTLRGGAGGDRLSGSSGRDRVSGGSGPDRLSGGASPDRLYGGGGADRIAGGSGGDVLRGGRGKDRFAGGSGDDTIYARDGRRELVDCGRGKRDRVRADRSDRLRRCERARRPA